MILRNTYKFLFVLLVFVCSVSDVFAQAATFQVDEIVTEGNRRIPVSRVESHIVQPNTPLTMQDINDSIKAITETGLFLNVDTDLYVEGDKFILKYIFKEMPLVGAVEFSGNDELSSDTLREELALKVGKALSISQIETALYIIRAKYEDKKMYGTKVSFRMEPRTVNSVTVYFDIEENSKAQIYNIWIYGNENISRDEILKTIPVKERGFWSLISGSGKMVDEMMQASREMLRFMYLERGYAKANIGDIELVHDEVHPERVTLIFRVDEGEEYTMRSIDVAGFENIPLDEINKTIKLEVGSVFNVNNYQADLANITSLYTSRGYAYANVEPILMLDDETHEVDITYKIEEGPLVTVERINISGNAGTNDNVIRRQIDQMEGALYNSTFIQEARANTMATGYFENVEVIERNIGDNKVEIDVNVKEQSTGSFTVGVAYSTLDGILGMVQFSRNNFLGLGHNMSAQGELSAERLDLSLSYTDPWFMDWPVSVGGDVFSLEREWYEYTRSSLGASLRVGHSLIKRKLYMNYRYSWFIVDIYEIDDDASQYVKDQAGNLTTSSFSPSLVWNTIDNPTFPTRGNKSELYFDYAGGFLGGEAQFYKVGVETTQYFPILFDGDIVLMLHAETAYIKSTDGSAIPIDERFRLGGINSLRGFDYGEVSPVDSTGAEYGGDKYYQGNVELIFPLKKDINLNGVTFFDIGNALAEGVGMFDEDPRMSAGVGLRWLTPMGPFRLEWGYKLNKRTGESPYKFEFSIGGSF